MSPKSGEAGEVTLTITITKDNEEYSDRTAYINIKAGIVTQTITLTQKQKDALILTQKNIELNRAKQSFEVELKSNTEYEITIEDNVEWLSMVDTKALTTDQINFQVLENTSNEERTASVVFKDKNSTLSETLTVTQSATANNVILYTTINSRVITPYESMGFGATIVSNTYENGVGKITFDANVTSIGYSAFWERSQLTSITIPGSVMSIGVEAFYGCSSLTSITIPESVTSIGESAFNGCSSLASITIESGITEIKNSAFAYCSELTSITIPESVTNIGESAFSWCSSLASVYCKRTTPPTLDSHSSFDKNAPNRTFYVPAASVDAYKAAPNWSDYAAAIVAEQ